MHIVADCVEMSPRVKRILEAYFLPQIRAYLRGHCQDYVTLTVATIVPVVLWLGDSAICIAIDTRSISTDNAFDKMLDIKNQEANPQLLCVL